MIKLCMQFKEVNTVYRLLIDPKYYIQYVYSIIPYSLDDVETMY